MVAVSVLGAVSGLILGALATPAAAHDDNNEAHHPCPDADLIPADDSTVRVVKVAGLIDPVVTDYVLDELDAAEADPNTFWFVLWVNSKGDTLDDDEFVAFAQRLRESELQVALWVGQPGSTAQGGAAELATVVSLIGVTPNSTIGNTGPLRLPPEWGMPFHDATDRLKTSTFTAEEAIEAQLSVGPVENTIPIPSFETYLAGFVVYRCFGEDGSVLTFPQTRTVISGLPLTSQLFHTISSPEVAYLFFVMGLGIMLFELFVAGVGVAGIIGAVFVLLGSYGLASLPTRWWAIALLLLAFFFLAIDIQTNVPRAYTILGVAAFAIGTLLLYDRVSMSWVTMVAGIIGILLYAYTGMPSMVRTRFSTPTIGRKWMIGEIGEALTDISPEGTVQIRDASWQAITNRATPVSKGGSVRVVGIDRLVLEIEPEEGGAKDYRERK